MTDLVEQAFAVIGLTPDAALVEIKKAYAALLKRTRPDDDPKAFQRLEEAYARCIGIARRHQQAIVRAALAEVVEAPRPLAAESQRAPEPSAVEPRTGEPVELPVHAANPRTRSEVDRARASAVVAPDADPVELPRYAVDPRLPVPAAPARTRQPAGLSPAALAALVYSIADAAARLGGNEFEDWLEENAALVPLDVQLQIAFALPAFAVAHPQAFDSLYLQLVYDYLVGVGATRNSFGDPELQRAREQVHANTSFAEELAIFRRGNFTAMERLALAELLDLPDPRRRRFLGWYPWARPEVEAMLAALTALDPERGRTAIRTDSAAAWMPPRGRKRRLQLLEPLFWTLGSASAMCIWLAVAAPKPPHPGLGGWIGMIATITVATFLLAGRLYAAALRHPPRAGRNRVSAGPDLVGMWICVLSLTAIAACAAQAMLPDSGFAPGPIAMLTGVLLACVLVFAGRFRFEAIVLYIALVYALLRALSPLGVGSRTVQGALTGISFAGAALFAWLVDRADARWQRLPVAEARKSFSLPMLLVAISIWTLAYLA